MNTKLYTKLEIAKMILNQFNLNEIQINKVSIIIIRLQENLFYEEALKAGIHYSYFGYNRYQIF